MYVVSIEQEISYAHRLKDHPGKCNNLHGHNALVRVLVAKDRLNADNMVIDFDDLKRRIATVLDGMFDHKTVLAGNDPLAALLIAQGQQVTLTCYGPPTAEYLAKDIFDLLAASGLAVKEVVVKETSKCGAAYVSPDVTI